MATQYTDILKLALPVQGELSGTWGDVVNDNITSMVEEAIAGRKVINTWTTNSHTLTTADGTTSESRAAILSLTDTGTALTGAGTVICPAESKVYIVENGTGQTITVKTSSGTGVAVPDGDNMLVFCDGTNVQESITNINSLALNGTEITATATELNLLDGVTATTAELNFVDGVTSNIQTQLDAKAPTASPTFTGTMTASGLAYPTADGTANQVMTTDGSGTLSFADAGGGLNGFDTSAYTGSTGIFEYAEAGAGNTEQLLYSLNNTSAPAPNPDSTTTHQVTYTLSTNQIFGFIDAGGFRTKVFNRANGTTASTGLVLEGPTNTDSGVEIIGNVKLSSLPTSDPSETGLLWNDGGAVVFSGSTAGISAVVDDTTPQLGGNLDVNGNSIVSASNGNIAITPNGTGTVSIDGLTYPSADGTNGQVLTTNGTGTLSFADAGGGFDPNVDNPAIGNGSSTGTNSAAYGHDAVASSTNGVAVGQESTVTFARGTAVGYQCDVTAEDGLALGNRAVASGNSSIAAGVLAAASATYGVAIGQQASVTQQGGIAIGYSTQTTTGVAIGDNAGSTSANAIAIGDNSVASGTNSVAVGQNTDATQTGTVAVGTTAQATGLYSVAIGEANAAGTNSVSIGVNSDARFSEAIAIGSNSGADAANTIHINASGATTNQPQTAGHMVIETDDARFQYGTNGYSWFFTTNEEMRLTSAGDLLVDGNVTAYSTTISDRRLKSDITNISNALDKVGQINGVTFVRDHNGDKAAGVVAQEIMEVLPEAVKSQALPLQTGTDDEYYVVEYDAVTGLLVEAVKELKARVEALEAE